MSAPESGSVLGIDVGWSAAKTTTGTAVIRWSPSEIWLELARLRCQGAAFREALHAVRKGARFDAAAIDGPLRSGFSELEARPETR